MKQIMTDNKHFDVISVIISHLWLLSLFFCLP